MHLPQHLQIEPQTTKHLLCGFLWCFVCRQMLIVCQLRTFGGLFVLCIDGYVKPALVTFKYVCSVV